MKYRDLGQSGLKVSSLCLGTMTFGIPVGEKDAIHLVHKALGCGINFIDTADIYEGYSRYVGSAGGVAEEILGKALKGRRDSVVVATKVGMKVGPEPSDGGLSRKHIMQAVEKSLKRLKTDYIDLYYLHKPDPETPLEETLITMNNLVRQGKVHHIGISNFNARETAEVILTSKMLGIDPVICHQPPYSILTREIEKELMPLCQRYGLGIVPYQTLQRGILTGKYRRGRKPPKNSRLAEKPEWVGKIGEATFNLLEILDKLAKEVGKSMVQYVIAWILAHPEITSVIIGIKREEQLEENLGALGWKFPLEHLEKIEELRPNRKNS